LWDSISQSSKSIYDNTIYENAEMLA